MNNLPLVTNDHAPQPDETRALDPAVIIVLLAAAGLLLAVVAEFLPRPSEHAWYALFLLLLGAVGWLLRARHLCLARPFLIVGVTACLLGAHLWLRIPGSLVLLGLPAGLAVALMGAQAGLVIGGLETALIGLLVRYCGAATMPEAVPALVGIWATLGIVYVVWQPTREYERWLIHYTQEAQSAQEEARDRRAQGEQMLAELTHAVRELSLANQRMAALRAVAEEAQKSKAAFVAKVSHEFRTPLNMIIGLIGLLVETPQVYGRELPAALFEDLKIVRRSCDHLSALVNDVLDLSQAEAGRLVLHRERVDLCAIMEEAINVVQAFLEKKGLTVCVEVPPDLPAVYCDRTRIRQVILNLFSNAVRFTERGGITARAAARGPAVVFSIADTGPGIPPEQVDRIFEPFGGASEGIWQDRRGSGLGLSISKQFIEAHEGRMWVESRLGAGTTFFFELPMSPPLPLPAGPARWISDEWSWQERAGHKLALPSQPLKPRVVVCDADGELHPTLAHYSDDVEFVDVRNLAEATEELRHSPAHAVLLNESSVSDLWTLVERLRAAAPDTPVIGCSIPSQMRRAREAGAADYLVRPVTQQALWDAIRRLGRPARHILVVDDDPDVRQLLARMLSIEPGVEVSTVANGAQGLEELATGWPDLLLLDLVMPGMSGWEVLRRKQQNPSMRDIPVILVSAQDRVDQPLVSPAVLATAGGGLSPGKVLRAALGFSNLLLKTEGQL